jgi:RNA polymerase sigma-70 factor (ECF subfamily)
VTEEQFLVRACLANEPEALREFVSRFQGLVFALCCRMVGHRQDAEDIAQEVFLRALRSLNCWQPDRPLRPWLMTIAANRCRSWLACARRRNQEQARCTDPADCRNPVAQMELAEELDAALASLRDDYRLCFVLYHAEGFSLAEIAQILGSHEGTIKTWLHRARKELAERMNRRGYKARVPHEMLRIA